MKVWQGQCDSIGIIEITYAEEYCGWVIFSCPEGKRKLQYRLKFTRPIYLMDCIDMNSDTKEMRRIVELSVMSEKTNLKLTNDDFFYFIQIILPGAIQHYSRRTNDMMDHYVRKLHPKIRDRIEQLSLQIS